MICPKCGSKNTYTIKSYDAGLQGKFTDIKCHDCSTKVVCTTIVVAVDPKYGEGAQALAKRARK